MSSFGSKYGLWALVAGASEGLGAAFATALAARKMNVLLLARRASLLDPLAEQLRDDHGVQVRTAVCDLARPDLEQFLTTLTSELELGVAIYNAAYAPVGELLERTSEELLRVVDVNVRGPLLFTRALAPAMVARKRGALVLMSSMAGFQGAPRIATYAASKAFTTILAESLWSELRPHGVDVLVSCAGAIRTPNYQQTSSGDAPGTLDAEEVAARTLEALGKGPMVVPGATNQLARFLLGRVLPRRAAISIMAKNTEGLS